MDEKVIHAFLNNNNNKIKILWGNCLDYLKILPSESIHLMVTSPPYYNARKYSNWENLQKYLDEMKTIIKECYRVLDNHRVFVFNISDIIDSKKDNFTTKDNFMKVKIPLPSYFINIFEECGFTYIDDFIWDKGEVQSKRHCSKPYPFYKYPINSYEHILIFHKHRLDKTKLPCPICGSLDVNNNGEQRGIQTWECRNLNCKKSKTNRGKRFSQKTILTQNSKRQKDNIISERLIKMWRKDICKFSPVIKINCKGENILGHTAPFPPDIPEMAVQFYSYKNELVLDPFAGSMTTAIIANKLERIGIGCELRKDLFKKCIIKNIENSKLGYEEFLIS